MLQDDFFEYLKAPFSEKHIDLNRRETQKWHKLYVNDKTICWMMKPNQDGSFWIFVAFNCKDILRRSTNLKVDKSTGDDRKTHVSLLNIPMSPIVLLDRGKSATGGWEMSWPVGFKIIDGTQFELAKRIIMLE